LSSADLAVERVAQRVTAGGHNVPEDTVRRRYRAGIRNFFSLYQPIVTSWALYNASGPEPTLIAEGLESEPPKVYDPTVWATAKRQSIE
jgi:predicted ABC-type ATPase